MGMSKVKEKYPNEDKPAVTEDKNSLKKKKVQETSASPNKTSTSFRRTQQKLN
jgi:hypothetical protein